MSSDTTLFKPLDESLDTLKGKSFRIDGIGYVTVASTLINQAHERQVMTTDGGMYSEEEFLEIAKDPYDPGVTEPEAVRPMPLGSDVLNTMNLASPPMSFYSENMYEDPNAGIVFEGAKRIPINPGGPIEETIVMDENPYGDAPFQQDRLGYTTPKPEPPPPPSDPVVELLKKGKTENVSFDAKINARLPKKETVLFLCQSFDVDIESLLKYFGSKFTPEDIQTLLRDLLYEHYELAQFEEIEEFEDAEPEVEFTDEVNE